MSKKLAAYFSASGTTAAVARILAEAAEADLYEIKPQAPYTRADLNWQDKKSRSSVEMNDKSFRPPLANRDAHVEDYDTIFLGFPIWWYTLPMAVLSFVDEYDFSGKTIVPFCTHGTGGLSSTIRDLTAALPDDVTILDAIGVYRPDVDSSRPAVQEWIAGLDLDI